MSLNFFFLKKRITLIDNNNNCEEGKDNCNKDLKPKVEKIFNNRYLFVNNK